MSLSKAAVKDLLERGYSRRNIAHIALGAAAVMPLFHEFAYAQQQAADPDNPAPSRRGRGGRGGSGGGRGRGAMDPDAVIIGSNENPMGPTKEGLEAISKVSPLAWRYSPQGVNMELEELVESTEGLKQGYATIYPGSGPALSYLHPAFTSPTRSWVMGSPGYGSGGGGRSGERGGKTIKVALRKDNTHDVEAMIKADPNAGVFYICNPNNPTGTITPRKDMEYILANKPKGSILVIDEAYVHFSGRDNMSTDLVAKDKDVIVLRTFSKIYGMAGLRAGIAYGRPDLLDQLALFGASSNLSQGTRACAAASLKASATVIPERVATYQKNRALTYEAMDKLGVKYIPTVGNFFMMTVPGMTGAQVGTALAAKKVHVAGANRWPEWPQSIRVTVGSFDDMTKFNAALAQVVKEGPPKTVATAG
jgi:histidinol-phosphate/aromatic aminotransferase/cobyric acid decarboxylase-like protein